MRSALYSFGILWFGLMAFFTSPVIDSSNHTWTTSIVGLVLAAICAAGLYGHLKRKGRVVAPPASKDQSADAGQQYKLIKMNKWAATLKVQWSGAPRQIKFAYKDSHGELSQRVVKLTSIQVNADGEYYLVGYCAKQEANRHFKAERITSPILDRGQAVEVFKWIGSLGK